MLPESVNVSSEVSEKASTPTSSKTTKWVSGGTAVSSDMDDIRKRVLAYTSRKTTITAMVLQAINELGADERGASVHSITKWIIANSAVLDMDKTKLHVKKAVLKALSNGLIERAETSKKALGAMGSFILSKNVKSNGIVSPAKLKKLKTTTVSKQKIKHKRESTEMKLDSTPHKENDAPGSEEY